jgi:hypothetical protein
MYKKLSTLSALLVLVVGTLTLAGKASAAGSGTIYISPDKGTYAVGSTLTAIIREDSGATAVNAVSLVGSYNASSLQFLSFDFTHSAFEIAASSSGGSGAFAADRGTTNTTLTGDQEVARINFKALASGQTSIDINNSSVVLQTSDSTDQVGTRIGASLLVSSFSNPDRMMMIDGSNHAYSEDLPSSNGWLSQIGSPATANSVAVGGNRMMAIWTNGVTSYTVSKDSPTSAWVNQTTGAQAIAVGANSEMMVIDSAGGAYAKMNTYDPWVKEIGGGAKDISIGGNGRLMVVDSANNAYSKEGLYDGWRLQVVGAKDVEVGPTGRMMVIDSAGNVYQKDNPTDPWVQQIGGGGAKAIAVGGGGRMMVIDRDGNVYSKDSIFAPWVQQIGGGGAKAIAVGSSGRMTVIDSSGHAYVKDHATDIWAPLTGSNGATAIAIG